MSGNDELLGLLDENLQVAERNRQNLEVYVAIAQLCRQNLEMLHQIADMDAALQSAVGPAHGGNPREGLAAVGRALDSAVAPRSARNRTLPPPTESWYKSWHPRRTEAKRRKLRPATGYVKDQLTCP